MSFALKTPARPDTAPETASKFSTKESTLRSFFVAAFTGAEKPEWAFRAAVSNVTDDVKLRGDTPEELIKRIKYIAAIPLAFHYRVGYNDSQSRLAQVVSKATSIAIDRYFVGGDA
jgi:hypothetical protein